MHRRMMLAALLVGLAAPGTLFAASPTTTTIHINDMHCPTCAKRIASRLYTVAGVVRVSTDVAKGVAIVTPQSNRQPSPRGLWDAVEKAGFQPTKIEAPNGTYTEKPNA
jgi:copper chaperone CopZ